MVLGMDCYHGMWYLGQSYYAVWYLGQIATTGCGTWDGLLLRGVVRGTDLYYWVWYTGQIATTGCGTWDGLLLLGVVRGTDFYYGVWYAGQIPTVVCMCTSLLHLSCTFSVDERLLKT